MCTKPVTTTTFSRACPVLYVLKEVAEKELDKLKTMEVISKIERHECVVHSH